ncbi:MAG: hypothetical protein K8R11_02325 [Methanococcoides sp.]|nr:hypothetical protein [Methanococcoides sp.]
MIDSPLIDKTILPEVLDQLPRSLKLFCTIEEQAQTKFDKIMSDIETGKTTLEAVKRERGIL